MSAMIRNRESKPRVYFAHCMKDYGTKVESQVLNHLRQSYSVICPNNDIGQLTPFKRHLNIVSWADAVIAMEHEGYVTMGVFNEARHALETGIPVWCIRRDKGGFIFYKVDGVRQNPDSLYHLNYGFFNLSAHDSPLQ